MTDRNRLTSRQGQPLQRPDTAPEVPGLRRLHHGAHLLEKLSHLNRERIPERVVHAKGAGAYGYFEVTEDVGRYTCARFLSEVGKRTEVFVRFSTSGGERGSADSERDPRGFAIKFYTEEGNYDLVGSNSPVFFIRDPFKFPDLVHSQKRNPETNLKDPTMFWDFLSLSPETLHQVTLLFTERGTPASYRHMHGYGTHTFLWYNELGEGCWVRYHLQSSQGSRGLAPGEAERLRAVDPDHATRDLFEAIAAGDHPAWDVFVQLVPLAETREHEQDLFDSTRVLPKSRVPLRRLGRLVLTRNPRNYFAEVEQAAFSPGNFVPGIGPSPDPLLEGRIFSYGDAHYPRLGVNYGLIRVNRPRAARVNHYHRDGSMRTDDNFGAAPNYFPNSFGGPAPGRAVAAPPDPPSALPGPLAQAEDHFKQPGELYRRVLSAAGRAQLVENLAGSLGLAIEPIRYRQAALFYRTDAGFGVGLARRLSLDPEEVARLAGMTPEERARVTSPAAWVTRVSADARPAELPLPG
jgi:catalase